MRPAFTVLLTPRFERECKKLLSAHDDLAEHLLATIRILSQNPFNTGHTHAIKKLVNVPPGQAQFRFRSGRVRFRYDVEGQTVYLKSCSLRREDTYR
jgi:mRNA-degrading endonuclease RelE of RelBE toxin-antitoxin system